MLFEHGVCLGDSLLNGARTRFGLAESLSDHLNVSSNKRWLFRNEANNGDTVLALLRRIDQKPWMWRDATFAVVLIGTNDSKSSVATPPAVFRMLYGQLLDRLLVHRLMVFPALIPDMLVNASLASPYDSSCLARIAALNAEVRAECAARDLGRHLIDTTGLEPPSYIDGVHLSEAGIAEIARRAGERITAR